MFAPFNKDHIWSAYPPHANKENIKKIPGGPSKFALCDLKAPNYQQIYIKTIF